MTWKWLMTKMMPWTCWVDHSAKCLLWGSFDEKKIILPTYLPTHYLEGRVAKGETTNFLRLAWARALETGRKETLWLVFLACITGSANKCIRLPCQKVQKTTAIFYWKDHKQESFQSLSRMSSVMLALYCDCFFTVCSTGIRYQEIVILYTRWIKQNFICITFLYSEGWYLDLTKYIMGSTG